MLKAPGKYPSIINYDAANAPTLTLVDGKPKEEDRNKGGKLGTGTVSVTIGGVGGGAIYAAPTGASITQQGSLTLNITDKDFERFNFNYRL